MRANCTSDKPVVKYREDEQLSTYSWFIRALLSSSTRHSTISRRQTDNALRHLLRNILVWLMAKLR